MHVLAVVGPTASGKSGAAIRLAEQLGAEIVSVDSMQVYEGLDIGTAKPTTAERQRVPHHLIDVAAPEEPFSVAEFQKLGIAAMEEIAGRGAMPLVVGGSGLHFRALVDPLDFPPSDEAVRSQIEAQDPSDSVLALLAADPRAATVVDLANPRRVARALEVFRLTGRTPTLRASSDEATAVREYRPRVSLLAIGMDAADSLAERVEARFDEMLEAGLLAEVERLQDRLGVTAAQGVGYKELLPVVRGEVSLDEGRAEAIRATMALAKRQRTFFRRDPRIRWIPWHDGADGTVDAAVETAVTTLEEMAWIS
jgi:tRNA dimethylallyltransferase